MELMHVTAHSDAYSGGISRWKICVRDAKCGGYDYCKEADNDDGYECVECVRSMDCVVRELNKGTGPVSKPICNSDNECIACENNGQCDDGGTCESQGHCSFPP